MRRFSVDRYHHTTIWLGHHRREFRARTSLALQELGGVPLVLQPNQSLSVHDGVRVLASEKRRDRFAVS